MRTLRAAIVYWKLAIFRVSGKALIAVALSIAQGLNGVNWYEFTGTQKFVTVTLAVGSGWAIVDAFLDTTMGELRKKAAQEEALVLPPDHKP